MSITLIDGVTVAILSISVFKLAELALFAIKQSIARRNDFSVWSDMAEDYEADDED
jgi:hypothetical protein